MTSRSPAAEPGAPSVNHSLSEVLQRLVRRPEGALSIGQIVAEFGPRAFGALLFIFSAPNLLPLPPGSSTVLGAPLLLVAPQVALGVQRLWLPGSMARRQIAASAIQAAFARLIPWLERVERVSRPRLTFLFGPAGDRVLGFVCTALTLVLILPIPFGNLLPAAAICTLALSLVQRDGLIALLGYGLAAASWGVLALAANVIVAFFRHALVTIGLS